MGLDLKQVVAGVLTVTMFVMLGNMIKRDHFSSRPSGGGEAEDLNLDDDQVLEHVISVSKKIAGPWEEDGRELKPCWDKPDSGSLRSSKGFVTFSLTNGPEYHVSQVADAVVVARYLRANLVLPDIRGSEPADKRSFGDVYDEDKFIRSLEGVVNVVEQQPSNIAKNHAVVKVPNRITEDSILGNVKPIFKKNGGYIRLGTYFPSVNMKKAYEKTEAESIACLAMFSTLELQPDVQEVVDFMVERLRAMSLGGKFLAVYLRLEMLANKNCQLTKTCFGGKEIAEFLQKIGFGKDTTIYLTQSKWDSSLDTLKDLFPKTYTKEEIIPADKKTKFLASEDTVLEKVLDYYVCVQSDIFVPAISGLFYANVVGTRIALGRTQVYVPANVQGSSASATEFVSTYVSQKNHLAYSCFC